MHDNCTHCIVFELCMTEEKKDLKIGIFMLSFLKLDMHVGKCNYNNVVELIQYI